MQDAGWRSYVKRMVWSQDDLVPAWERGWKMKPVRYFSLVSVNAVFPPRTPEVCKHKRKRGNFACDQQSALSGSIAVEGAGTPNANQVGCPLKG